MRAKCIDADIRVAGMDEDLLVLLIPGIERVPVEAGCANHPVDRVVAEDPHGARAVHAARSQAMASCRTLAEALLVVFVNEKARVDVIGRDVVLRVVRPFPDIPRPGGVENLLAVECRPHAPRRGFDVIGLCDHLGVVATGGDRCYSHRASLRAVQVVGQMVTSRVMATAHHWSNTSISRWCCRSRGHCAPRPSIKIMASSPCRSDSRRIVPAPSGRVKSGSTAPGVSPLLMSGLLSVSGAGRRGGEPDTVDARPPAIIYAFSLQSR